MKENSKSKQEIAALLQQKAKTERQRTLARLLFPAVETLPTIYDAQTAFNATAGFIKMKLIEKENSWKVSDLAIDISKVQDGAIKDSMTHLLESVQGENAKDALDIITAMGQKLPEFLANKHLKDPMSTITAKEYIAD